MSPAKTYALHPGNVLSRYDGDRHFITAQQLAKLYGVDIQDCIVMDTRYPNYHKGIDPERFVHLYPRSDGNYALPDRGNKGTPLPERTR